MMEMFSKQGVSVPVTTMMVMEAYQHVKQGGEAAGIDGMTWEYLHTHRSRLLYQLWVRLASGSYFPKAIKAVSIQKGWKQKSAGPAHVTGQDSESK